MFRQKKIGIIILIITLIIGFVIFIKKAPPEETSQRPPQENGEEIVLNSKIVEEQVIKSDGEGFPRFIPQEGVELIIALYQYTWDIKKQKLLEFNGMSVFKYDSEHKIKKIDQINFNYGFCFECFVSFSEKAGIKDLNNDGIKELIININDLHGSNLMVYTWINGKLNLINPTNPEGDLLGINANDFVDIDNDGKTEISLLYRDYVRLGPNPDDIRIDVYERIYKWDGTEKPYYLWKEEKLGEEKPEEP